MMKMRTAPDIDISIRYWLLVIFVFVRLSSHQHWRASAQGIPSSSVTCHGTIVKNRNVSCTQVSIPPAFCEVCHLGSITSQGKFEDCTSTWDITDGCMGKLEHYLQLNPCDTERADAMDKYKNGSISSTEWDAAHQTLDFFLYAICEQSCDCLPTIGADLANPEFDVRRGNCPAHHAIDVCRIFPEVKVVAQRNSTSDPWPDGSESWEKACPRLLEWYDGSGRGWATQPDNAAIDGNTVRYLEQFLDASQVLSPIVYAYCLDLETSQGRIDPEPYPTPSVTSAPTEPTTPSPTILDTLFPTIPIPGRQEATVLYRINCGGASFVDTITGLQWSADTFYSGGDDYSNGRTIYNILGIADPELYESTRYDPSGGPDLSYSFPVTNEFSHLVRLHFAENFHRVAYSRTFDVLINGVKVLRDFDIALEAGGVQMAVIKEFAVPPVTNGIISILFLHVVDLPKVSGIEIFQLLDVPTLAPSGAPTALPTSNILTLHPTERTTSPSTVPSSLPSSSPSAAPSGSPNTAPSGAPTAVLSNSPSAAPSSAPSNFPNAAPSGAPTTVPSSSPSAAPSSVPSSSPNIAPSGAPTTVPSSSPSAAPSSVPSSSPNIAPSRAPSAVPSSSPSAAPSAAPSSAPSSSPSGASTTDPSTAPSIRPSTAPSKSPSTAPSSAPSTAPSASPSTSPFATPSALPTTLQPTKGTTSPSTAPSSVPSSSPSADPSSVPSSALSSSPSTTPTASPSFLSSATPTALPTLNIMTLQPTEGSASPSTAFSSAPNNYSPTVAPNRSFSSAPSVAPSAPPGSWLNVPTTSPSDSPSSSFNSMTPSSSLSISYASVYSINSGGFNYTDSNGMFWSTDAYFSGGASITFDTNNPAYPGFIGSTTNIPLFETQRFQWNFETPSLKYDLILDPFLETEELVVRLYFAEIEFGLPFGERSFDIKINGELVVDNFDIALNATGPFKAATLDFSIIPSSDTVSIEFDAELSNPMVAGVELLEVIHNASIPRPVWLTIPTVNDTIATHENCLAMGNNGKAYQLGGRGRQRACAYDPILQSWDCTGSLSPISLHHMQCVAVGDEIWMPNPWTGRYPEEDNVPDIHIYNTTSDTWRTLPGLPEGRRRGSSAVALHNGYIYVSHGNTGGHGAQATSLALFDRYDITNGVWEALPDASFARDHTGGGIVNGTLFCVAGGRDGGVANFLNAVVLPTECYDLVNGIWMTKANIPQGRAAVAAGTTCDGKLIIAGGEGSVQSTGLAWRDVHVFDGTNWEQYPYLKEGRHGTGLAVNCDCGGQIYISAGSPKEGGGKIATTETLFLDRINTPCPTTYKESSASPLMIPSSAPSRSPSTIPSYVPSTTPSASPRTSPSVTPLALPTTMQPTEGSASPSTVPSSDPSQSPSAAPTSIPSSSPSSVSSTAPSASPSTSPSATPSALSPVNILTLRPTKGSASPSSTPSSVQGSSPSFVPNGAPTTDPSTTPSSAPSSAPSSTPSTAPIGAPSSSPSSAPSTVPSSMPSTSLSSSEPTSSPVTSSTNSKMESLLVDGVVDSIWTSVSLLNTYKLPIPVCSVSYTGADPPTVVRVQNVAATSFQVRLQNPSGLALSSHLVHCIVVESGAHLLPDGRAIEAQSFLSSATDGKFNWNGQAQSYLSSYTQPVVFGQVITSTDPGWSVFWSRGSDTSSPASSTSLYCGKHVGEDSDSDRADETVGFVVVEAGSSNDCKASLGLDTVHGIGNSLSYSYSYELPTFGVAPEVIIVTQAAMDGNDGSWAVLSGTQSATSLGVVVDEDQIIDTERRHTTEQVGYMAFATQGSINLSPSVPQPPPVADIFN